MSFTFEYKNAILIVNQNVKIWKLKALTGPRGITSVMPPRWSIRKWNPFKTSACCLTPVKLRKRQISLNRIATCPPTTQKCLILYFSISIQWSIFWRVDVSTLISIKRLFGLYFFFRSKVKNQTCNQYYKKYKNIQRWFKSNHDLNIIWLVNHRYREAHPCHWVQGNCGPAANVALTVLLPHKLFVLVLLLSPQHQL